MNHNLRPTSRSLRRAAQTLGWCLAVVGAGLAQAADEPKVVPPGGTIGYVLTDLYWSMYQTPNGKTECPKGFNAGPREQFAALFPASKPRQLADTQLKYEAETWHPTNAFPRLPFHLAEGPTSFGMNLDGQVSPEDFTSPAGEKGVDNQLYRIIGCINGFRGPEGVEFIYENMSISVDRFNRMMVELSGVDDLKNDKDVVVTIYRGMDRLMTDATGNKVMPGGSQRIDVKWGQPLMRQTRGQIVDGVLITEPLADIVFPWQNLGVPSYVRMRDGRLKLDLSSTAATGIAAGYADVESWYKFIIRNDSTHHLGDGQISAISMYQALQNLADGHPNASGKNTAISASLDAKFVQVFIQHPDGEAEKSRLLTDLAKRAAESASRRTASR